MKNKRFLLQHYKKMVLKIDVTTEETKKTVEDKTKLPKGSLKKRIRKKIRIWRANFSKMPLFHKLVLLGITTGIAILASIAFVYSFVILTIPPHKPLDTSYKLLYVENTNLFDFSQDLPIPPTVKDQENPINGELYTKLEFDKLSKQKPLMVMIENHVDARPQAGLSQADLVYETLVESGITRFMAVYWGKEAEKIGPIRSIRKYYLDWSAEYDDPPIVHIGQAGYEPWEDVIVPEADARSYIRTYNVKSFMWYGRSITWRDHDKFNSGIAWEHVAYSDTATAWADAKELGWTGPATVESLSFKRDIQKEKRPFSQKISIRFLNLGGETYKVDWEYDKESNTYKRDLAGQDHLDENNNKQLSAKNVILQYVNYSTTGDRNGRIVLTTLGNGKAKIFRDGKEIDGVWEKGSRTARTKFYNSGGEEINLNRGQIWIEVIPVIGTNTLSQITIS